MTVSGVQCGKHELQPATQIPAVDAKWNEMFPSGETVKCPLFAHSNDQYGRNDDGTIAGDISSLADSLDVECGRVIFGGPSHSGDSQWDGPLEATFMLSDPGSPTLVKDSADASAIYVLMPMRV